jgi:hypothetical protein
MQQILMAHSFHGIELHTHAASSRCRRWTIQTPPHRRDVLPAAADPGASHQGGCLGHRGSHQAVGSHCHC